MCRAAILLLTALVVNSELQNEEIKVLIRCTKFLRYFSSLSYHWELFPENCLVKIVVLSGLVHYLQDMLIWLNTSLVTVPAATPSPVSWLCPASGHSTVTSNSQALLYRVMSFLFSGQSSPGDSPSVTGDTHSRCYLFQHTSC